MAGQEGEEDRLDRELIELLNELRVALPGVQVLFAFLLTVPFSQGFARVTEVQRTAYVCAFFATTIASILLISPSAYHRLRWREHDKERMLETSNRLAIVGIAFLALAIAFVAFVVTDVLYGNGAAAAAAAAVLGLLAWFWFGLPLSRAVGDRDDRKA